MKKRGLSAVITTVILILLVMVSVGIVWFFLDKLIGDNVEEMEAGSTRVDLKISSAKIYENTGNLTIRIEREIGKGDLSKVKIILSDGENSESFEREVEMDELDRVSLIIDPDSEIEFTEVSVAPIIITESGKEFLRDITDTEEIEFEGICIVDNSCKDITCIGETCRDDCENPYDGKLESDCVVSWECGDAPNGCGTCGDGCNEGYICNASDHMCVEEEAECDGLDEYTVFLLNSNTTDDSTIFTDTSSKIHVITIEGDTHHETDQKKFGSTSIYFDGEGDYLSAIDSEDWYFEEDDFTIDLWFFSERLNTKEYLLAQDYSINDPGTPGMYLDKDNSNNLKFYLHNNIGGMFVALSGGEVQLNNWHHVTIIRDNDNISMYLDGNIIDSDSNFIGTIHNDEGGLNIGVYNDEGKTGLQDHFEGYIDELRISKGVARWTTDFTPPTGPYCIN